MHTIHLFGPIGKGFDFFSGEQSNDVNWMVDQLAAAGNGDVEMLVNSDGGDVFEAKAMMEILAAHPGHTTTRVLALAASAASWLILAADRVEMAPGAQLVVHNPFTMAMGDAAEMRKTAERLDHIRDTTVLPVYLNKTGLPMAELVAMLDAETWIDTDTALEKGFIDGISASQTTPIEALLRSGVLSKAGMNAERYTAELKAQRASIAAIPLLRQREAMKSAFGSYYKRSLTKPQR